MCMTPASPKGLDAKREGGRWILEKPLSSRLSLGVAGSVCIGGLVLTVMEAKQGRVWLELGWENLEGEFRPPP